MNEKEKTMDNVKYARELFPGTVQLKYLTGNCYEIKLPGDVTLVTDPFIPTEKDGNFDRFVLGCSVDDLDACDYVLIGHSHTDHIGSLDEVFDRFQPKIMCHESFALNVCFDFRIGEQMIIPFHNGEHFDFADFSLDTTIGHHTYFPYCFSRPDEIPVLDKGTKMETLNKYGGIFNSNFVITAKNNYRIGFCAGTFEDYEANYWKNAKVNLLMRQCNEMIKDDYRETARTIMATGAEIMIPLHQEKAYDKIDFIAYTEKVNEYLEEKHYSGRMFWPEVGVWYRTGACIGRA